MQAIDSFLTEWTTAERNGDTGALEKLLADDFTAVGPLGFILAKRDWLARHRPGGVAYESFDVTEVQPRVLGEAAVVLARNNTRGTYQGHPMPAALRVTLVLVSDVGHWKLAASHMSFIAGTPGAPPIPGAGHRPEAAGGAT